jgi:GNAT superfamily N-acetyltransferase
VSDPATDPANDRAPLLDLLERVWGERPDREELDWWFDRSPAGPGLLTVERNGDRAVGLASLSFLRSQVGGREQLVAMPLQVATDVDQRGKGIFGRLERTNEDEAAARGCELGVTFPNDASRPIFLERLGWHELWRGRLWLRPPLPPIRRGALRIEELGAGFEGQSLDQVRSGHVRGTVPHASGQIADAAFLEWRYLRSPRAYRLLGAFRGESLAGVLALRPRRGRIAVVCHALGEVAQLLRATASARPTIALVPREERGAFLAAGFVPTPKPIRVLGKKLRPEGDLDGPWQFQLGDFDVF